MDYIIEDIEDLLSISDEVRTVQIDQDAVLRYIYDIKKNGDQNDRINADALKKVYMKSIRKAYDSGIYSGNITVSKKDIKKVCVGA